MTTKTFHENRSQRRIWYDWIAMLFGIGFFSCLIFVVVFVLSSSNGPFSTDTSDPDMIESNAEIVLPSSASDIQSHHEGLREIAVLVRFSMLADDLPGFLDRTQCRSDLKTTDIRQQLQNRLDRPWWSPNKAEEFQWCSGGRENFFQTIFIDMTNVRTYIVYVVAGTT